MYFRELTMAQKKAKLDAIQKFADMIPDYEIYIMFGTLLGCIREGSFIQHDNDIDMCYLCHSHNPKGVEQEIKDLYIRFIDLGIMCNYFTREKTDVWFKEVRDPDVTKNIIEPFGQNHVRVDHCEIDLFASWVDEKGCYYTCQWGNFGNQKAFFPFIERKIYDYTFKIPNNSETLLRRLYGNWEIPLDEKSHLERKSYLKDWLELI